jgi:hypothetical protein
MMLVRNGWARALRGLAGLSAVAPPAFTALVVLYAIAGWRW